MKSVLIAIFILISFQLYSQTIQQRFDSLNNNSETFKEYKVIKINELKVFWKSVISEFDNKDQTIANLEKQNEELNQRITSLEKEMEMTSAAMVSMENATTHINVLGLELPKTVYIAINFFIIVCLGAIIGVTFISLKEKMRVAKVRIKDYENLEEKFESFRKNSLEKQMKLRRELQTERNRLEEIKSI